LGGVGSPLKGVKTLTGIAMMRRSVASIPNHSHSHV
jgi:hypothetical protein